MSRRPPISNGRAENRADLLLLGFGYALFSSPNMNAIMGSVEKRYYGIASGAVGTMRLVGMVFSMGIATVVLSVFIGRGRITEAVYPGFLKSIRVALLFFTLLCLAGVFASLARGRLRPEGE